MNPQSPHPDHGIDAGEWQRQERALEAERRGQPADADLAGYRRVARALLRAPDAEPPADFAAHVATRAETQRHAAAASPLERALFWLLWIALAVAALETVARSLADGVRRVLDAPWVAHVLAGPWMLALLACLAVSWLLDGAARTGVRSASR